MKRMTVAEEREWNEWAWSQVEAEEKKFEKRVEERKKQGLPYVSKWKLMEMEYNAMKKRREEQEGADRFNLILTVIVFLSVLWIGLSAIVSLIFPDWSPVFDYFVHMGW